MTLRPLRFPFPSSLNPERPGSCQDEVMPDFDALLTLQGHDTTLAQLHHRRSHLPQHTESDEVCAKVQSVNTGIASSRATHQQLAAKMAEIEHHVHELDAKIESLNGQMFGDSARSPRELQAIEADIESVRRHRSTLEDQELELIETFEPHDIAIKAADRELESLRVRLDELGAEIAAAQSQIDIDAAVQLAQRSSLAASIDASTVDLYEKIRTNNRGIGAARLEHGTCMSCRLKIAAVELDRIRHLPLDALVRCDECGAILVR